MYGYSRVPGYHFSLFRADCDLLLRKYPFVRAYAVGCSVLGKPLIALRLGEGGRPIHMNGSFHANEWITSALLMRFLDDLAGSYAAGEAGAARLYKETTLWAVPMVNPDGVDLSLFGTTGILPLDRQLLEWNGGSGRFDQWKANIRGVDLNDQFPAGWEEERLRRGVAGPGPRDYAGICPLSEPEAQAMASFTMSIPFDTVIALHTQGKEIYWNYKEYEPADAEELAARLGQASGYKPVKLTDSDAGYKDWFIKRFRRPGFTVEAGEGVNPLPYSDVPAIYAEVKPLLLEAMQWRR
ncbi:M14 family metallopeptidase [Paenibacillus protaetiae]|uniref:Peptidase M14 n=1 Tax=Paenibacillus protaetiae TaxID=2509456 RepID=A0A4V0YF46_9BACL|nr:M14 family metallocarboxypeptidase [Paenibacillus protaetiae]QAY66441.1 peptidase M14 [Paenibacillus protaetiae]